MCVSVGLCLVQSLLFVVCVFCGLYVFVFVYGVGVCSVVFGVSGFISVLLFVMLVF